MSELPELPDPLPPGSRLLSLSAETVDYLCQYWEIRDHGEIFGWAVKMLYDLTKLDEAGWHLTLTKAEIDEHTKQCVESLEHRHLVFLMKWLCPTSTAYPRLPTPEMMEQATKIAKP